MLSILCILLGVPIDIARARYAHMVFFTLSAKKIPCQTMIKKLVLLSSLSFLNAEKKHQKTTKKIQTFSPLLCSSKLIQNLSKKSQIKKKIRFFRFKKDIFGQSMSSRT